MGVPQLTSCCCGCSLETGTKIIGWLQLIPAALLLVATIIIAPIQISELPSDEKDEVPYELIAVIGVLLALTCGLATMLLMGAYQKRARLVVVWVIIILTFSLIRLPFLVIMLFATHRPEVLIQFLAQIVEFYFILVVFNFYREIRHIPQSSLNVQQP